ncbi:transglutaminase-like cysteine peptidase [Rhizobiales bacterium]|uniref:transglutaminase-like cysteine peptidase n=1 Tax=Hongsoonwoonella zoysiae TaxID=2821844 RepID=UPI001560A8B0|nr:transglutaminase-like cysteine peptidase [Hongsoonwoonella zoysiae]NRG17906.1 transglutaminase-like cysteine peptidase [Hongsoonwoonella zoysiae]
MRFPARFGRLPVAAAAIYGFCVLAPQEIKLVAAPAHAAQVLKIQKSAKAPRGFAAVCGRYRWACSSRGGQVSDARKLELARKINSSVNRSVRSATDAALYGREEYWTLPSKGQGDCEDYSLLKMKRLIEAGVPSRDLMLATVLTDRAEHHVVLVLRTGEGDYFLDNLRGSLRTWERSGYTVVKMQNPRRKSSWGLVLSGPLAGKAGAETGSSVAALR